MTMVDVAVVIVAFHRPQSLEATLARLADPRIERIVVNVEDDAGIAAIVCDAGARAIGVAGNPGYAAAVNTGAAAAQADLVVFANDDVLLDAEGVLALASTVAGGQADVAVPRITTADGAVELTIAPLPTVRALAMEWLATPDRPVPVLSRVLHLEKWRRPVVRERILAASASVVACRAALLRQVPLPEDYFLYWEESEWFWWLAARHCTVVYDPAVVMTHVGGRADVRPAKSRLLARNAVRCVRRTQGRPRALLAWLVVLVWNARLVLVDGTRALIGRGGDSRVRARLAGLHAALVAIGEVP